MVYTSFFGAAPDCTFTFGRDHWHTEELIRGSGLRHTFLRDNLHIDFLPLMVGADGVIRGPAGDGRVAAARDDIADVAVLGDAGDGHDGRTYDMTGPEALTMAEAAEELSRVRRTDHRLPRRDPGGGLRVAGPLRRPRLGGRRGG